MRLLIAAASAMLLAGPALAADKNADPDKKVCRRYEVTGSIIGSKAVCHTRTEWSKIDEQNGTAARDTMDNSRDQQNQASMRPSQG